MENAGSIRTAIVAGVERFGGIDVLVNNAGFGAFGPLEATPIETIRRQFEVNLIGLLQVMQAVLPHFRKKRSGKIINVTSVGGRLTFPFGSLYHGSKFAVEGVTEALQYELAPLGIQVKLVEPGRILTDFAGRSMTLSNEPAIGEYQPLIQSVMNAYGAMMAGGSEPEVIAETIFAAATDGSDTLRYAAGPDADPILGLRAATGDAEFFAGIRAQFGLDG